MTNQLSCIQGIAFISRQFSMSFRAILRCEGKGADLGRPKKKKNERTSSLWIKPMGVSFERVLMSKKPTWYVMWSSAFPSKWFSRDCWLCLLRHDRNHELISGSTAIQPRMRSFGFFSARDCARVFLAVFIVAQKSGNFVERWRKPVHGVSKHNVWNSNTMIAGQNALKSAWNAIGMGIEDRFFHMSIMAEWIRNVTTMKIILQKFFFVIVSVPKQLLSRIVPHLKFFCTARSNRAEGMLYV